MTKDLSRQLCELAGIKAKYICSAKTEQEMQCMICRDYNSKPEIPCYGCRMSIETYPNFESPENFVKLLECLFQFPFNCEAKETYVESILCGTIEALKNNDYEQLKQALQATDWVY